MVKTLERHRYALCEKHVIVPFCCSYQVYRYLAGCFGLISCRHYLGHPQLVLSLEFWIVGSAFDPLTRVLPLASWHLQSYQRRKHVALASHEMGLRLISQFPSEMDARISHSANPALNLVSSCHCSSVVPFSLWATYRFPAMLHSRFPFGLR